MLATRLPTLLTPHGVTRSIDRPELPLRVIHKPGPVAAGMEALLTVELAAGAAGDFVGEVGGGP